MRHFVVRSALVLASLGLGLVGCSKAPTVEEESSTVSNELSELVGVWYQSCSATSAINGQSAWVFPWLEIQSDGDFSYGISYYSNSNCTGTAFMHQVVQGVVTYAGATTSPAGGKHVQFATTYMGLATTTSTDGRDHLNTVCSPVPFNLNGGVAGGGLDCTDNRFDQATLGSVANLAVVVTGTVMDTTAMNLNLPGVTGAHAASTSLSWSR